MGAESVAPERVGGTRGRRTAVRTALAVLLAALPAASGAQAAGLVTTPGTSPERSPAWVVDRVIRDRDIYESSGLASSLQNPGVLWTHNDSGNAPMLYAIGTDGRTRAHVKITDSRDRDWEAIASFRDSRGRPVLAVGDIGDNAEHRKRVDIQLLGEPGRLGDHTVRPALVLRLKYPGGPVNAETLLADPRDGRLYVVTKGTFGAKAYAVPPSVWPGTPDEGLPRTSSSGHVEVRKARLRECGRIDMSLATDGEILQDGRVLLRSYLRIDLLPDIRSWRAGVTVRPLASTTAPVQAQGESLAVVTADGDGPPSRTEQDIRLRVLLGSEGEGQPVLSAPLPAVVASGSPAATPVPSASVPSAPEPSASGSGSGAGGEVSGSSYAITRSGTLLVAFVVLGLSCGGVLLALRHRRRRR